MHHPRVKKEAEFENGYIAVRGGEKAYSSDVHVVYSDV